MQENRGGGTVLTRRWREERVARSFSEDFRTDGGTQAVEKTSAGEGPQFCPFLEYLLLLRRKGKHTPWDTAGNTAKQNTSLTTASARERHLQGKWSLPR